MKEEWKPISGYTDKYAVSNMGRVFSRKSKTILKPQVRGRNRSYLCVQLYADSSTKRSYDIHRLVAEAFIDNPDNLPIVNHRSGDKLDCAATNLEWATHAINVQHAYDNGLIRPSHKGYGIAQCMLTGELIATYPTYMSIQNELGIGRTSVYNCCMGYQASTSGYTWRFASKEDVYGE